MPFHQQPTSFTLRTYTLAEVFDTPELISSLAKYAETRQSPSQSDPSTTQTKSASESTPSSVLFLQVHAAADYFTTKKSLMQNVPPVNVDLSTSPLFSCSFILTLNLPVQVYPIKKRDKKKKTNIHSPLPHEKVLDPYLLSIFPTSLLPTAIYILLIALIAYPLSDKIYTLLHTIATAPFPAPSPPSPNPPRNATPLPPNPTKKDS